MPSRPPSSVRPATTWYGRLVAAVLSVVMTVVVALVAAPPAAARLHNLVAADDFGLQVERFRADDALYATFTSDFEGGYVCVVDASVTNPASASCLSPAWGSPNRFVGIGTIIGRPIEAPLLPVGEWRLLAADTTRERTGTALSPVFRVLPCVGTCDTGPAEAALAAWKARAGVTGQTFDGLCTASNVLTWVAAGRSVFSVVAFFGLGIASAAFGLAWGVVNFFQPLSTSALGLVVVKQLSCATAEMMADIHADPPDFAYGTVAQPVLRELPVTGDAALDALARAYRDAEGYGVASRIAFERYQGAMIDGDLAAAAVQADATAAFTRSLVAALRQIEARQPAVSERPEMAQPVTSAEALAELAPFRDRVATDGYTPEEVALLLDAGATPEQVAALEDSHEVGDVAGFDPTTTTRQLFAAVQAELPATITAFDTFGRQLSVAAAELREAAPGPEPTQAPTPTPEPTQDPTPEPTQDPAPEPTQDPTPEPTQDPTPEPTQEPEPTDPPAPLAAGFTVSTAYDAASSASGARIASVTSEATSTSYRATNLLSASGSWRSATGATTDQDVVVELAGRGLDLVDRVVLTGTSGSAGARDVEVAVSATEDGEFTTVATGALPASTTPTALTFAPRTVRYVRVRVLTTHGNAQYVQLAQVSVPTPGRDGGVVSLDAGRPATATASSVANGSSAANPIARTAGRWVTAAGQNADQWLRVDLGGEGVHRVDRVVVRGAGSTQDPRDVEVLVSPTGEPGSFVSVLTTTLERSSTAQELTFPAHDARAVELRILTNHGATAVGLNELRVLTTHGLGVADGTGVGAAVTAVSGASQAGAGAIDDDAGTRWRSVSGQTTDQHLTVLLRNGEVHDVDRVVVQSASYRPRNVEVLVSDDGADFTRVAAAELPDTNDEHHLVFAPVAARFVQLHVVDGWTTSYVAVNTLRVHSPQRGSGTDVPFVDLSTGGVVAHHWDLGDGTTSDAAHPVHTYAAPGRYDVTLTVTDATGATATATRPYVVPGVPVVEVVPVAGATTVDEKASVALRGQSTEPVVRWAWDLGYTVPTTTAATVTAQFPDDGTYTVTARAMTADGLWSAAAPVTFTVRNVAPTVDAGTALTVLAGDPVTPVSTVTDPADRPACTWQWGDGTPDSTVASCTSGSSRVAHTYALPGTYTATLTADDGDGGVVSDTVEVTVTRRPAMLQVVTTGPQGADLQVRVRLMDGPTTNPVAGETVTVAADTGTPVTGTTDAQGYVDVVVPGAAGADTLDAVFAGSTLHDPTQLTRAVRLPAADIVFMIDESGSMSGAQTAVRQRVREISQGLAPHLDFRLGLVGYGGHVAGDAAHVHTPLTHDLPVLVAQLADLRQNGGRENGFEATTLAMSDAMGHRPNAGTCTVVVTDEPATGNVTAAGPQTQADALAALTARDATFFGVIATGNAQSVADYGVPDGLAGLTGGRVWSINDFTRDASSVLAALVEDCVTAALTPDLAVTVDAGDVVDPDAEVTATVTATNEGAVDVTGVVLTDALPAGTTFVAASDGGTYDAATGLVTWPAFDLAAGATAPRTVTLRTPVPQALGLGDHVLTHRATVRDDGTHGPERDLTDNEATATVTVRVTHVPVTGPVVEKTTTGTEALADGRRRVTFALTVSNPDAFFAAPYVLAETPLELPAGVVVEGPATVAADLSVAGTPAPLVGSYDAGVGATVAVGTLQPGGTHRYLVSVVVALDPEHEHGTATCDGTPGVVVTNTAALTWDGTRTTDAACAAVHADTQRHGVGVTTRHDAPEGVAADDVLTWTVTVTNHGTVTARDVAVAPELPARFALVDVDAGGWDVAPADGRAADLLRVTGGTLAPGASHDVVVRGRLLPLPAPVVVEDEGPLDADLPAPVAAPEDDATLTACVAAARDDDPTDDCATQTVPLRDVVAAVTVRLSGGAPYALVSTRTTRALAGADVELLWQPLDARGDVASADPAFVAAVLARADVHTLAWPGVSAVDGVAHDWPGWRPATAEDLAPGAVVTGLVLDPAEADHAWRALSRLTFTAADASTGAVVRYREVVELPEPGDEVPAPGEQPAPAVPPAPGPSGGPVVGGADVAAAGPDAPAGWLATTGGTWFVGATSAVLAMLILGAALLWRVAERRRRDEVDGLAALTGQTPGS